MKKTHLFVCFSILLWGTSTAIGQGLFGIAQCDPCEPASDPCGVSVSPFTFGGWLETGIYTNSHGWGNNGPMHSASLARTDFQMNQL